MEPHVIQCYDVNSIQLPVMGNISGGQREFIPYLVRSAVANGLVYYLETHTIHQKLSDAILANIKYLKNILYQAKKIHQIRIELHKKLGEDNIHPQNE